MTLSLCFHYFITIGKWMFLFRVINGIWTQNLLCKLSLSWKNQQQLIMHFVKINDGLSQSIWVSVPHPLASVKAVLEISDCDQVGQELVISTWIDKNLFSQIFWFCNFLYTSIWCSQWLWTFSANNITQILTQSYCLVGKQFFLHVAQSTHFFLQTCVLSCILTNGMARIFPYSYHLSGNRAHVSSIAPFSGPLTQNTFLTELQRPQKQATI